LIFGDEIWFDFPPFLGLSFFEKSCSTMSKSGVKFYFRVCLLVLI